MDAKITLSFNKEIIDSAKRFADSHNISLSRLTEYLYRQITTGNYKTLEDLPISDWVMEVAEGPAEYKTQPRKRKAMKQEYFKMKK